MTIKNGDMPAMPIQLADGEVWSEEYDTADGLSKREMIAMHMMAAMLSRSGHSLNEHDHNVARNATRAADALLTALDRTK